MPQTSSSAHDDPFTSPPRAPEDLTSRPAESSLAAALQDGDEVPNFRRLAPEIQADLIRALERMSPDDQRDVVSRMRPMGVDELIGLALNPNPSRVAPRAPSPTRYTVRRGDSLSKIAREHGLGLRAVIDANPQITNPNLIYPDQEINLPI